MSWILATIGIYGLYLAGRRSRWGWAVGLAAQVLWAVYAVTTAQWGFIASACAYGFMYLKNFLSWSRIGKATPNEKTADMRKCTHKLYPDEDRLLCDVCKTSFSHSKTCPGQGTKGCLETCAAGDLDFTAFTADNVTDRVLDDMRGEIKRLAYELDIAHTISIRNKDAYVDSVRTLLTQEADLKKFTEVREVIRKMHRPTSFPTTGLEDPCAGCGYTYPCATVTALEGT